MMRKTVFVLMVALLMGLPEWALAQSKATRPSGTAAALQKAVVSEMSVLHPVRIERASVLSEGELVLDARLAVELNRELSDRDYDNVRLTPIGMRYGVDPSLEVGGFLGFAANDKDDRLAPDDSGLEGLTVFGKLTLNEYAALQVGLRNGVIHSSRLQDHEGEDLRSSQNLTAFETFVGDKRDVRWDNRP